MPDCPSWMPAFRLQLYTASSNILNQGDPGSLYTASYARVYSTEPLARALSATASYGFLAANAGVRMSLRTGVSPSDGYCCCCAGSSTHLMNSHAPDGLAAPAGIR